MSDAEARTHEGRRALLVFLAILLAILAAAAWIVWWQIGAMLRVGDQVVAQSDAVVSVLNESVSQFKGDPQSAAKADEKLQAGKQALADVKQSVDGMSSFGSMKQYRTELNDYVALLDRYYSGVQGNSNFVLERGRAFADLGEALDVFSTSTKAGSSPATMVAGVTRAGTLALSAATRIQSLDESSTHLYSTARLSQYASSLASDLVELGRGLAKNDAVLVTHATLSLKSLFGADWESLFYQPNPQVQSQLELEARRVTARRSGLEAGKQQLESRREPYALAAVALTTLAILSAIGAVVLGTAESS